MFCLNYCTTIFALAVTSIVWRRRHPPPSERKLGEFKAAADMLGVKVDSSSAGALQASLNAIRAACKDDAAREVSPCYCCETIAKSYWHCSSSLWCKVLCL
jgi:exoribonuclease R